MNSGRPILLGSGMLIVLVAAWAILAPAKVQAANPDTAARCAQVRNDDTVRPYDASLRAELIRACRSVVPRRSDLTARGATETRREHSLYERPAACLLYRCQPPVRQDEYDTRQPGGRRILSRQR